jgi:hypothetical protein
MHSHGNRCLKRGMRDRYKAASAMLGYGVKTAKMPAKVVATNKGCLRRRIVRPGIYDATCSQKTPRKNSRKESNISMKKYHQRPTVGVRSERSNRTPYVAVRNSQEPVSRAEIHSRPPLAAASPTVCVAVNAKGLGADFDLEARAS